MKKLTLGLVLLSGFVINTFAGEKLHVCTSLCAEITQDGTEVVFVKTTLGKTKSEAQDKIYNQCSNLVGSIVPLNSLGKTEYPKTAVLAPDACDSL